MSCLHRAAEDLNGALGVEAGHFNRRRRRRGRRDARRPEARLAHAGVVYAPRGLFRDDARCGKGDVCDGTHGGVYDVSYDG
mmetsp:Transcript_3988/g.8632  ORF Transcript_3988/g.8632 Transcript_3988/m.8632 type:complete len:81 (+) Transcript_3988:77-319(+)